MNVANCGDVRSNSGRTVWFIKQSTIDNNFTRTLLKAVFLQAFNAFLRLGEILIHSPKEAGSVIQKQDVSFTYCNRRPQSLTLVISLGECIKISPKRKNALKACRKTALSNVLVKLLSIHLSIPSIIFSKICFVIGRRVSCDFRRLLHIGL
jgi:hypothetical protein